MNRSLFNEIAVGIYYKTRWSEGIKIYFVLLIMFTYKRMIGIESESLFVHDNVNY